MSLGGGGRGAGYLWHLHKLREQALRDGGEVVAHQTVVAPTRVRSALPERGARCRDTGHLRSPPVHAHGRLHFPADTGLLRDLRPGSSGRSTCSFSSFCGRFGWFVCPTFEFLKRKNPGECGR
jgi:hypothetical protein